MLAALPAVVVGMGQYGVSALGVVSFSIACAMLWELLLNKVMGDPVSIGDGNAAVVGLLFAMLLPASTPWWTVLIGTFLAIVVGKQIYGGMGSNPFNPSLVAFAIVAPYVTHMGMVLDDRRHFIHIMRKRSVAIERLNATCWQRRIEGIYEFTASHS